MSGMRESAKRRLRERERHYLYAAGFKLRRGKEYDVWVRFGDAPLRVGTIRPDRHPVRLWASGL